MFEHRNEMQKKDQWCVGDKGGGSRNEGDMCVCDQRNVGCRIRRDMVIHWVASSSAFSLF